MQGGKLAPALPATLFFVTPSLPSPARGRGGVLPTPRKSPPRNPRRGPISHFMRVCGFSPVCRPRSTQFVIDRGFVPGRPRGARSQRMNMDAGVAGGSLFRCPLPASLRARLRETRPPPQAGEGVFCPGCKFIPLSPTSPYPPSTAVAGGAGVGRVYPGLLRAFPLSTNPSSRELVTLSVYRRQAPPLSGGFKE